MCIYRKCFSGTIVALCNLLTYNFKGQFLLLTKRLGAQFYYLGLLLLTLAALPAFSAEVQNSQACFECHADKSLVSESDPKRSLYVDKSNFEASVHGKLNCVECHGDANVEDFPHPAKLKPATCDKCHATESKDYSISRHARALNAKKPKAPTCITCHGKHDILSRKDLGSQTYVLNINRSCLSCHGDKSKPLSEDDFTDRIHENGAKMGLKVTAVCTNCHNSHDVLRHSDRNSPTSRGKLVSTCSACHAKIEDLHRKVFSSDSKKPLALSIPECGGCHALHAKRKVFPDETFNDDYCLSCHSASPVAGNKMPDSLMVSVTDIDSSAHKNLHCIECHENVSTGHNPVCLKSGKVNCASCHSKVVQIYDASIHGVLHAKGDGAAPTCVTCHGTHATRSKTDSASPISRLNIIAMCGKCHKEGGVAEVRGDQTKDMWEKYAQSIHGQAVIKSGLTVAAICIDCHSTHGERAAGDTMSTVGPAKIVQTCSQCHKGIYEKFSASVHSPLVTKTDKKLPVCSDCHPSHDIIRVDRDDFRLQTLQQCGKCHLDVAKTYFETYHGKKSRLGSGHAAKCSDCHGSHSILAPNNPNSALGPANIVQTCKKCHTGANKGFTGYLTHAHYGSKEKYPLLYYTFWAMSLLLFGTFGFFGLHTALWVPRSLIERLKRRPTKSEIDGKWVRRFPAYYRVLHVFVIVSFLGLALTGMALKFSEHAWAEGLSRILGGIYFNGLIHRFCALITFGYFSAHIIELFVRMKREKKRWIDFLFLKESMVPNIRDVREFIQSVKWFVGLGPRPIYGRWTYWEKFDYFAVFWGVAIIGSTGLVLWFPEFFTRFFPGWIINIATIIHGDEALLAVGFIFTIHFFNTHFRPDKFPMDLVIFTGRVPFEVFAEERPRELAQLQADNSLDGFFVAPPSKRLILAARIFGTAALITGLMLVGLIIGVFASKIW